MPADAINVRVTLFGTLRGFAPDGAGGAMELRLPPGATIAQLREAVGLPATTEITVGVNGAQTDETASLRDGDQVMLFNALSGGAVRRGRIGRIVRARAMIGADPGGRPIGGEKNSLQGAEAQS